MGMENFNRKPDVYRMVPSQEEDVLEQKSESPDSESLEPNVDLSNAVDLVDSYANGLFELNTEEDMDSSEELRDMIADALLKGQAGVEGLDRMIDYMNATIQSKREFLDTESGESLQEFTRRVQSRDAFMAKRAELQANLDDEVDVATDASTNEQPGSNSNEQAPTENNQESINTSVEQPESDLLARVFSGDNDGYTPEIGALSATLVFSELFGDEASAREQLDSFVSMYKEYLESVKDKEGIDEDAKNAFAGNKTWDAVPENIKHGLADWSKANDHEVFGVKGDISADYSRNMLTDYIKQQL